MNSAKEATGEKVLSSHATYAQAVEGYDKTKQLASLTFIFPQSITAGDCTIKENSVLVYYADGSYSYSATTRSSDTNDEWSFKLKLRDANHGEIYKLPPYADYNSYHMDNANNWYSWSSNRVNPDPRGAAIYARIRYANYECGC